MELKWANLHHLFSSNSLNLLFVCRRAKNATLRLLFLERERELHFFTFHHVWGENRISPLDPFSLSLSVGRSFPSSRSSWMMMLSPFFLPSSRSDVFWLTLRGRWLFSPIEKSAHGERANQQRRWRWDEDDEVFCPLSLLITPSRTSLPPWLSLIFIEEQKSRLIKISCRCHNCGVRTYCIRNSSTWFISHVLLPPPLLVGFSIIIKSWTTLFMITPSLVRACKLVFYLAARQKESPPPSLATPFDSDHGKGGWQKSRRGKGRKKASRTTF